MGISHRVEGTVQFQAFGWGWRMGECEAQGQTWWSVYLLFMGDFFPVQLFGTLQGM